MARHALGLGLNDRSVSYRNRYALAPGDERWDAWYALVRAGLAGGEMSPGQSLTLFYLTQEGAEAVLQPNERLDAEDFPKSERRAARNAG